MNIELLKQLCTAPGLSGREEGVRAVIMDAFRTLTGDITVDSMGNVTARLPGDGTGPRVMVAAHMDQIGFIVKHVEKDGWLKLQRVGGVPAQYQFARGARVFTRQHGMLNGLFAYSPKAPHNTTPEDAGKLPRIEAAYVDLGLPGERVNEMVSVGDVVLWDAPAYELGDMIVGPAMDDRAAVFVMIEAARQLRAHSADIHLVATAQEEVGLRGAAVAAYRIEPDVAIALDVTVAADGPGVSAEDHVTALGKGAAIKIQDGSVICHPPLVEHLRQLAETHEIAYQMEILPAGGTDAGAAQRARAGCPTGAISIPTRYLHGPAEMVHRADLNACIQLMTRFLEAVHEADYRFS